MRCKKSRMQLEIDKSASCESFYWLLADEVFSFYFYFVLDFNIFTSYLFYMTKF